MFEITEERLREIEEEGCGARPFRQELKLLVDAYRFKESLNGLTVTKGEDGAWLNFKTRSKKKTCVSIEVLAANTISPIIAGTLRDWSDELEL